MYSVPATTGSRRLREEPSNYTGAAHRPTSNTKAHLTLTIPNPSHVVQDFGGFSKVESIHHYFTWGLMSQFLLQVQRMRHQVLQSVVVLQIWDDTNKNAKGVRVNDWEKVHCINFINWSQG